MIQIQNPLGAVGMDDGFVTAVRSGSLLERPRCFAWLGMGSSARWRRPSSRRWKG